MTHCFHFLLIVISAILATDCTCCRSASATKLCENRGIVFVNLKHFWLRFNSNTTVRLCSEVSVCHGREPLLAWRRRSTPTSSHTRRHISAVFRNTLCNAPDTPNSHFRRRYHIPVLSSTCHLLVNTVLCSSCIDIERPRLVSRGTCSLRQSCATRPPALLAGSPQPPTTRGRSCTGALRTRPYTPRGANPRPQQYG